MFTGSKTTYNAINAVLKTDLGLDAQLYPYPTDILQMGVDSDDRDMMTMLMRVAYVDVDGLWERRGGAENEARGPVCVCSLSQTYVHSPI